VLVIRAWLDKGGGDGLRARIIQVLDVSSPNAVESVATSERDVVNAVRAWLQQLAGP
jgi:hypothetical protein